MELSEYINIREVVLNPERPWVLMQLKYNSDITLDILKLVMFYQGLNERRVKPMNIIRDRLIDILII